MKIVLIRHGKPNLGDTGKIKSIEIGQWIESYNAAKIDVECQPKKEALEIAKSCNRVVCSDLSRSIESANILGVKKIHHIERVFREAELPYAPFPFIKLEPNLWAIIFRVLWFCGLKSNSESLAEARIRAAIGVRKLKEIAENKGSVIFIGHGLMNRFIAKALLSSGWVSLNRSGGKYWEFGVYEYSV